MEELTGVVRSMETKQSEATSGEVGKWQIASPSSSGREVACSREAITRARRQRLGGR
jgi:hypothetical protein